MSHAQRFPFRLVGQLEGYTLSQSGKVRRLLIKVDQGVHPMKLSHASRIELLRSILNKKVQQGSWVEVVGVQKMLQNGTVKGLKAEQITPVLVNAVPPMPLALQSKVLPISNGAKTKILVCQKSDCCKRGSAKVQRAIEAAIGDRQLDDQVCVKAVGCLKHCSKGPNIVIGKTRCSDVKVKDVRVLLNHHLEQPLSSKACVA